MSDNTSPILIDELILSNDLSLIDFVEDVVLYLKFAA